MLYLFLILTGLVALYLLVDYIRESRTDRTRERLMAGVYDTEEAEVSLWGDAADLLQLEAIRRVLGNSVLARRFDRMIKHAGIPITLPRAFFVLIVLTASGAGAAYAISHFVVAAAGAILVIPAAIWALLQALAEKRTRKLDAQLPALVSQLLTTLRSGGTPVQAMQAASRNAPSPVRESMAEVLNAIQIGVPAVEAWRDWALFWNTRSTQMLSIGIRLKWETGGQMTAILAHILETMEFHHRMELRVQTITMQAKLGSYVLAALPFGIGGLMYAFRPEPIDAMFADEFGQKLIWGAVGLLTVGFFWLRRIARLDS